MRGVGWETFNVEHLAQSSIVAPPNKSEPCTNDDHSSFGIWTASVSSNEDANAKVGRQEKYFFVILVFYWVFLYFGSPVCFYFHWNSVDSSVSFSTKWWALVLELSATVWRQRGNGAVEVSFESRTTQMSTLFHIFTCVFLSCVISLIVAVPGCFA